MLGSTFALTSVRMHEGATAGEALRASSSAKHDAQRLRAQVRVLEANLAKSLMINEALWELMRDRLRLTEKDLHDKLYEVDMRDGQLDGKNQRKIATCPNCHRKVSPRHPACIYCGHIIDTSVFSIST